MREKLLKALKEKNPDIDFEGADKLIEDQILDSVTTIEIIALIATEFGVEIPFEEYTASNFNSIDSMIALIEKYI